ncbi:hypothetical protein OC25_17760 [Pedobacter kyungheensis]|uniref:Uncharacterized protein n=1 Tax=Pedobacter kyungheensis TaxID=1069985 RepID=A0A0C1FKD9_9SPHI|nr:hypothetical protein [Pedobacter kyungheensis]KIA92278.1 hypothetical protein OC25_17760 [Pedobacter kyungheensis]
MINIHPERRNVTPEMAVRILKRYGRKISLKEARLMMDFMYNLAILSLNQVINDERMRRLWEDRRQNELVERFKGKKVM